ncbi:MAG: MGH1-like glycoside hydrolase domain-containing protein [Acidimicrobiales bacterium]
MSQPGLDPERERLGSDRAGWLRYGPYVAERAWGTVREDYSSDGDAWASFPHDHARSRAYRWSEDGLGAISDDHQYLCFGFAFWNGVDQILKERIFGLAGPEGNHGEDAKEYWWYEDSTPTHSYMRWRYVYPTEAFPYEALVEGNRKRSKFEPELELEDTGVLAESRYFDIVAEYAKAAPDDICIRLSVTNRSPEPAALHVLPSLWARNVWSWGIDDPRSAKPDLYRGEGPSIVADHAVLGRRTLVGSGGPTAGGPTVLFCENETNTTRLYGEPCSTRFPKDGIGGHVVSGTPTVNPDERGTKAALWYQLALGPGEQRVIDLRYSPTGLPTEAPTEAGRRPVGLGADFSEVLAARRAEADQFYAPLIGGLEPERANIARRAFAGMLWSKQLYHYDVRRWLRGDPAGPTPPAERWSGRNATWQHLENFDIISMPDKWEYPWYASWDLCFHCMVLAHVDPVLAKEQLILLCREWYMHPNGQLPAYEWSFSDVNPPVQAEAAIKVFQLDGATDFDFLERIFHKLLINFTWWVNREDLEGNNVFQGGFLGLDNIGAFDRDTITADEGHVEQSDGTAWMAMYCLNLLEIALILAEQDPTYEDLATKFIEHFAYVAAAMQDKELWDEADGFYYDVLHRQDGEIVPLRVRSMVGLLPLGAVTVLSSRAQEAMPAFALHLNWFVTNKPEYADVIGHCHASGEGESRLLSVVSPPRLERILQTMLAEGEFLSTHGLRSVAASHREHPFSVQIGGILASVDYEAGESTSGAFGGNSNWRGPVWFPVNYLVISALRKFAGYFGDELRVAMPSGSATALTLSEVADELSERLISLFLADDHGRRPVFGASELLGGEPGWADRLLFYEYFHGDTGAGLGASHQTGWTGLVADLLIGRAKGGRPEESGPVAPNTPAPRSAHE